MLPGYKINERIHIGMNVDVYRAIDLDRHRQVVIKLPNSAYPSIELLLQLRHQFAIGRQLHHPYFLETYSLDPYQNGYALVMEDNLGISLAQWLTHSRPSVAAKLQIAIDLASALHQLNQQRIVHKDLNPANITIHPDTQQIKIIDFGIASILPKENIELASPNVLAGTLPYIAPEQTGRMNRGIDYRCDLYSLGITLYQLFTGKLPFNAQEPIDWVDCHLHQIAPTATTIAPEVPALISQIIAKLMAKHAEDRYQTALGLKFDLERCQEELEAIGDISEFALGERDRSDRFIIPDRLYGRETAVKTLLDAFARVASGSNEFILVAGESGSGKTAVINEVHQPITQQRGYFIKGKFDQFNRDLPLSAFVLAFRDLIGQIVSESEERSIEWKRQIINAIGDRGRVLIEVIPELERIIGTQPEVAELTGAAAKERFNWLFQKFIKVFVTKEHPLTIFIDDLQWADADSFALIELLMGGRGYLLLLGAYRDNEVSPIHPLLATVKSLKNSNKQIETIALAPLNCDDIDRLIADTLHCAIDRARPLAEIIARQTHGNPFFTTQLLTSLYREGKIWFDRLESALEPSGWVCDLPAIAALSLVDDAVEFMAVQLHKLPRSTQYLLELAACIGNRFDLQTLAIVAKRSPVATAADLWDALQSRFIVPDSQIYKFFHTDNNSNLTSIQASETCKYRFLHDRVQQAAYSLIPADKRAWIHLQIGRLLLANTPTDRSFDRLFEIVEHLNLAQSEIESPDEIAVLARLNLDAARRAKASIAYSSAFNYARSGVDLLGESGWQDRYQLTLALHETLAEAAFLKGDFAAVPALVREVIDRARSPLDRVKVYEIIIHFQILNNQCRSAIISGLEILHELGIKISLKPSKLTLISELARTKIDLHGSSNEWLLNLPQIVDRQHIAALRILNMLTLPAYLHNPELMAIFATVGIRLTLKYGNSHLAAIFYGTYALVLASLGDWEQSYRLGKLAIESNDRFPDLAVAAHIKASIALFCQPIVEDFRQSFLPIEQSLKAAIESGSLAYVGLNAHISLLAMFYAGTSLTEITNKLTDIEAKIVYAKDESSHQFFRLYSYAITNLRQTSDRPDLLAATQDRESAAIERWRVTSESAALSTIYCVKTYLAFVFEDLPAAIDYADLQLPHEHAESGSYKIVQGWMVDALVRLAIYSQQSKPIQKQTRKRIDFVQKRLSARARLMPGNCQHKYDLVEAEKCRVFGKYTQAIEYYDRAIVGAQTHEYIQEEALANELAAKFYRGWGKAKIAATYMQSAYYCYVKWGATAKTADLERRYPELLAPILQARSIPIACDSLSTLSLINQQPQLPTTHPDRFRPANAAEPTDFDLAAAIQTARELSIPLELPQLLEKLSQISIEYSGAQICILILRDPCQPAAWQVCHLNPDRELHYTPLANSADLPQKFIERTIERSQTTPIERAQFGQDEYLQQHQPQSAMCLPISHRGEIQGIIYLEHRTRSGIFTAECQIVLEFLASQAAISIHNAQLYTSLAQRSAAIEASLDGFALVDGDRFIYLNRSHAEMFGYTKDELMHRSWHCLYSVEQLAEFERTAFPAVVKCGQWRGEAIATRKDGTTFNEEMTLLLTDNQQLIYICRDVTDRKQAERTREFTQFAVDNSADGLAWVRPDGSFAYGNKAMCQMLGYSLAEFTSLYVWDIDRVGQSAATTWPIHWEQLKQLGKMSIEREHCSRDGRCYPVEISLNYFEFAGEEYNVTQVRDITNRQHAELALRQSEARYQKLADNIPGAIYQLQLATDGNWSCPYISSGCLELFEISAATVINDANCLIQMMHPDDRAEFQKIVATSARNLSPKLWEGRAILTSGEIKWIRSASRPERQPDGSIVWDGVMLDITPQKAAERERQRQQDALGALTEWSALGKTGNDFYRACVEYLAKSFELPCAFLTKPLERLAVSDSNLDLTRSALTLLWTGNDFIEPCVMDWAGTPCLATSQNRWGIFRQDLQAQFPQVSEIASLRGESYLGVTIVDTEGQILGTMGIIDTKPLPADIAAMQFTIQLFADRISAEMQRHADEEELRRSQQQMKAFINNSAAAIYLKDLEGRYLLINQTCVDILDGKPELLLGKTDDDYFPPEIARRVRQIDCDIISSGQTYTLEETTILANGEERTYLSNKFVLTNEDGSPYALGGISTDITDRKRAEEEVNRTNQRLELANQELQRAARLKDEFLATMSHELRTPLNAILGMSEAMQEEIYGDLNERQMNAIVTIDKSGTHLLSLINDILDVSKMMAGKLELNIAEVSVSELCHSSIILVRQQAVAKQIQLTTAISIDSSVRLLVDERRMHQVLINLLNNAIKFTPDGGRVGLSVASESVAGFNDPCLCLAVSDTGIGIIEEDRAKLFQPFTQIDGRLNRKYQGTGLGLSIVKQIVELHGGIVTVASEVGRGSCFTVILPQACFRS